MNLFKNFFRSISLIIAIILLASCTKKEPVKIYIMAGQSNMEGPGKTAYLEEQGMTGLLEPREDVWCVYAGRVSGPLKPEYGFRRTNFGPELLFGHVMGDSLDNEIILFKSAIGGTNLHIDWRPPSAVKRAGGEVGPLYNDMIRRFHTMIRNLDRVYPAYEDQGYEIAGFIWLQGESDCCQKTEEGVGFHHFYKENLDDFIHDVRQDVGLPELPVIIVQINDGVWDGKSCGGGPMVREIEREKAESDDNIALVVTKDLDEGYHYDTPSHITIGKRIAAAALPFAKNAVHKKTASIEQAGENYFRRTIITDNIGIPDNIKDKLIGYWKFDDETSVSDTSPEGNTGTITGEATWVDGLFGKALRMRGNSYVEIPGFTEPLGKSGTIENLTISFWIQTPGKVGFNRIGKGTGHAPDSVNESNWFISNQANEAGWDIGNFNYDGFPHFTAAFEKAGAQTAYINWGEPPLDGDGFEWHHVVAVFNGKENSMKIYCDNHLAKKACFDIRDKGIIPAETALKIGGGLVQENNYQSYDEIAIWSRALPEDEINAIYNFGKGNEL